MGDVQSSNDPSSSLHWVGAPAVKLKEALRFVVALAGPLLIATAGASLSMVHVWVA